MSQADALSTRNPSRRQALTGALAVPFVFAAPVAIAAADPILDLIARHKTLIDACPSDFEKEAEARWLEEVQTFEAQFFDARPITRAGALAAARHALAEMRDFAGVAWAFTLLDHALDHLEGKTSA